MTNLLDNQNASLMVFTIPSIFLQKDSSFSLLLLGGFLGVSGSFLGGGLGLATHVQIETGVLLSNWLDKTLLVEVLDEGSGDRSTHLELLAKNGSGDAQDLGHLLDHSLVLLILQEDGIVKLFLNLNLGPGLLLSLASFSTFGGFRGLGIFRCTFTCILSTYLLLLSL